MTTRKNFLGQAALAFGSLILPATNTQAMQTAKTRFIHHVLFWLKNPQSAADRDKLVEGLKTLTVIEGLKDWHIGVPPKSTRAVVDDSFSISWYTEFENAQGEEVYQVHPVHLDFVKNYAHLWEKVLIYDVKDL